MHIVEAVADNDERQLIVELGLLEEVLHLFGVVRVRLAADALHFTQLAGARGRLDVLEVHFGVLRHIDDRAKVVVETLEAAELLKERDEVRRAKQV